MRTLVIFATMREFVSTNTSTLAFTFCEAMAREPRLIKPRRLNCNRSSAERCLIRLPVVPKSRTGPDRSSEYAFLRDRKIISICDASESFVRTDGARNNRETCANAEVGLRANAESTDHSRLLRFFRALSARAGAPKMLPEYLFGHPNTIVADRNPKRCNFPTKH